MKNNIVVKFFVIIFILLAFTFTIHAQVGDSGTFDSINNPTEENTRYIQEAYADNVFNTLDENLAFFNDLYNKVNRTDDIDSLVGDLEDGFGKLSVSFRKLADNREQIEKNLLNRLQLLDEYGNRSVSVNDRVDIEIASLNNERDALIKELEKMTSDSQEGRRARLRLSTLDSKITSLRTRKNIWNTYVLTHQELRKNLGDLTDNISLFLYALEQTAEVYEEAYETLKFANRASQAIESLKELADIEVYSESLLNTFEQVDEIMLRINELDFSVNLSDDEDGPISMLKSITMVMTAFIPVSCQSADDSRQSITWKHAMEKYQELVERRNDVVLLMQNKSRKS